MSIVVVNSPIRVSGTLVFLLTCLATPFAWADPIEVGQAAYERGDFEQAFAAWSGAAADGDPDAQYALGALYSRGRGVNRNQDKANEWYLIAARNGQVEAQYRMGIRFRTGDGLPKDFVRAYRWLRLASSNGHRKALGAADRLSRRLTSEQRAAAAHKPSERGPRLVGASPLDKKLALVRKIQVHLRLLGYDAGAVDGIAGSLTVKAVQQFQRHAGLEPDGRISAATLADLQAALAAERGRDSGAPSTNNE